MITREEKETPSQSDVARMLYGAPLAAELRASVAEGVADFGRLHGYLPTLAVVIVGDEPAARIYLGQILKGADKIGIPGRKVELPAGASPRDLRRELTALDADPLVAGVIVQMPLPARIPLHVLTDTLRPEKDIDGSHPVNLGLRTMGLPGFLPAVAEAAVQILTRSGYRLEGLRAVVIGRSNVVGKPVAMLLLQEHCTVTIGHRRSQDLAALVRDADIVVSAAGSVGLITGDMLKPGALVVDVGINVVADGVVGDVDLASARPVAAAVTPVPGGVGPLTNAILMEHLLRAASGGVPA
ncbi:bifunctional 5,10-methylenetetrahydrofolate dehydrogenase/5,10-methenyltetrahydrofolate cyclohydrolase [soil metagenome]